MERDSDCLASTIPLYSAKGGTLDIIVNERSDVRHTFMTSVESSSHSHRAYNRY